MRMKPKFGMNGRLVGGWGSNEELVALETVTARIGFSPGRNLLAMAR